MKKYCTLGSVFYALMVVGAINWGLVGLAALLGNGADWNVVHALLGKWMTVENVVYVLVGLSGVWGLVSFKACCGGMCPANHK